MAFSIGLDYGTGSVRCVIADTSNGNEIGEAVFDYETIVDTADHNVARQNPADYLRGAQATVNEALEMARKNQPAFSPDQIVGMGIDTTGSTPIPVNAEGVPLSMTDKFAKNPNALAWLWKDHTAYAEAAEITALAQKEHPEYLGKCGGTYSSEWFFSKVLHCLRIDPKVFDAAHSWMEHCDWLNGVLCGIKRPEDMLRSRCAAGHKAMFNDDWGGLPAKDFLSKLDPRLGELRDRLYDKTYTIATPAGKLCPEWARKFGLPEGIPVAVGAFDAHMGAVGSGIQPGTLVKIIGTSTCDMIVAPAGQKLPDVPGVCGVVDGSVLPGHFALEAGQSAVGDIFNWFVNNIQPGGKDEGSHQKLTEKAAALKPGQSGLLALDWNNGNRCILVDQRLTGLLLGQTLHTKPEEIYRALIEATAFGALTIINRVAEYDVNVSEIINCGGIAEKNPMLMQIYADVTDREMKISRSSQSCALGAAMAGAVVAGTHKDFAAAQEAMSGLKERTFKPIAENQAVYARLYKLYMQVHDAFGLAKPMKLDNIMKELLNIKQQAAG